MDHANLDTKVELANNGSRDDISNTILTFQYNHRQEITT